jgi:hypothetical protein
MPDYFCTISKVSNKHHKEIKIVNSILSYYYYFNKLGEKTNSQMKMKIWEKPVILLGKFKIDYDKENLIFNTIVFYSNNLKIILKGSFIMIDNTIVYYKHREVKYSIIAD